MAFSASLFYFHYGSVGIGCTDTKGYKLAVAGNMVAEKVVVKSQSNWSDVVFSDNYKTASLQEIELFIKANGHLESVPTEAEVKEKGIDVGEMNAILLKKIEEMTLLLIEQDKKITMQAKDIELLKNAVQQNGMKK